jgi:hypothetical protein
MNTSSFEEQTECAAWARVPQAHPVFAPILNAICPPAKPRKSDLDAAAAMHDAQLATRAAAHRIALIDQVHEADALVLLHSVKVAIERSRNMHCKHWSGLVQEIDGRLVGLQDEIDAERAWNAGKAVEAARERAERL